MSTVVALLSGSYSANRLSSLGHKPTEKLSHGTFVFIPKIPSQGPAVVSEIPSDPERRARCCHGQIVGVLELKEVNRADEGQVEQYLVRLANRQGFVVTRLTPRCTTCHSHIIFSVHQRAVIAEPVHVVAQEHIDFMGGQCCDSSSERKSLWRLALRQLISKLAFA